MSIEESLSKLLQTRTNTFMRKNLDGTFSVTVQVNNPRRDRRPAIKVNGYNIVEVIKIAATQLDEALASCEMIP
jgi:hypothetical protein